MAELKTMEKVVLEALEDIPEARKDDYILMLAVCKKTGANIEGRTFAQALLNHKLYKIPNWKTVERCRRKIQRVRPDLVAPEVAEKRLMEQQDYREYSQIG